MYTHSLGTAFPTNSSEGFRGAYDLLGLTGGRFVSVANSNSDLSGRLHGPDGSILSDFVVVDEGGQYNNVRLTPGPGGGFLVAWDHVDNSPSGGSNFNAFLQAFSADGTPRAPARPVVLVDDSGTELIRGMGELSGGSVALAFSVDRETYWRLHDGTGAPVGPATQISGSEVRMEPDGTGGLWMTYGTPSGTMTAQHIAANGSTTGTPFALTGVGGNATLVPLGNGTLLAVGNLNGIRGRLFSADGEALGAAFDISGGGPFTHVRPDAIALPNGGAIVVWNSYGETDDVYARRIAPDGSVSGAVFRANSEDVDRNQTTAFVEATSTGDVLIGWVESYTPEGSATQFASEFEYFHTELSQTLPRLFGTMGSDRIQADGTAAREILGGDGADTLSGGPGGDVIYGGASEADLRDVIYGGNGNDSIDGGYGNDELRGDAGNDSIIGGQGVDTIIGGVGDDVLTGQTWSDVILGGDGFDFINGGFGHDRVNGGADADRFYHLGVEGHGSDWVQDYSDVEGDTLVFGGTGTIEDFQVNFTETANAGAAGVQEAFVIYKPNSQILWALVDGDALDEINIAIGGTEYDLLS
jgi:Ca2+-binding RTX toxin-like protein